MKKNNMFSKLFSAALILGAISSCVDEDRLTLADTAAISEEALTDSYYQDLDDMSGVAMEAPTDTEYSGGRKATTITIQDDRFGCQAIVVTVEPDAASTTTTPKGVLTVDFGTAGCADLRGNVRKGKLIFTYNGKRFQTGSSVITTTDNYTINGIKLEGTRTSTNVTGSTVDAPKFNVTLVNGKATFPDLTTATRESDITWSWIRGANPAQDQLVIDNISTASGTTRTGREYAVSLLEDLKYERTCFIATDGIKKYIIDGSKEILIDYGSGNCQSVSVTVNGVTRNIDVY